MIWKFLKQNVLFPKGLNRVQHRVSRFGLFRPIGLRDLESFQNPIFEPKEFIVHRKKIAN